MLILVCVSDLVTPLLGQREIVPRENMIFSGTVSFLSNHREF